MVSWLSWVATSDFQIVKKASAGSSKPGYLMILLPSQSCVDLALRGTTFSSRSECNWAAECVSGLLPGAELEGAACGARCNVRDFGMSLRTEVPK